MAKLFYMEGTETTLDSIIKENPEMLTVEEIKKLQELKVGYGIFIGNIHIERIR